GAVGPDGFPDVLMGQNVIHDSDTGTWVARLFDMAWAAQDASAPYTADEKLQILAFAYGFATHAAGDLFAHTLVNDISGGMAPGFGDAFSDPRAFSTKIGHIMVEGYIEDATPGFDRLPDRELLTDGDTSSTSTPGIAFDVPTRFIYDALLTPWSG